MPPQTNRNAYGPGVNLGPVQREARTQDLTVRPAATDGPDPNAGAMFGALQDALNLGVKTYGVVAETRRKENNDAFQMSLAEANKNYNDTGVQNAEEMIAAAQTDEQRVMALEFANRQNLTANIYGNAGNTIGSRLWSEQLGSPEQKQGLIDNLPGVESAEIEIAEALEQMAGETIPTYGALGPKDQQQLIGMGEKLFRDEINADKSARRQEAAALLAQDRINDANAMSTSYVQDPAVPASAAAQAAFDAYGANGAGKLFGGLAAEGASFKQLDAVRAETQTFFPDAATEAAYQSAVAATASREAAGVVSTMSDFLSGEGMTPERAFSKMVWAEWVPQGVTSQNVGSTMVETLFANMDTEGLDEEGVATAKAALAKQLAPQIEFAETYLGAVEQNGADLTALANGRLDQAGADRLYETTWAGVNELLANPPADWREARDQYTTLSNGVAGLMTSASPTGEFVLPKDLASDLNTLASSPSIANRLTAMAVFDGLGGSTNPEVVKAFGANSEALVTLTTASLLLGDQADITDASAVNAVLGPNVGQDDSAQEGYLASVLMPPKGNQLDMSPTSLETFATSLTGNASDWGPKVWGSDPGLDTASMMEQLGTAGPGLVRLARLRGGGDEKAAAANFMSLVSAVGYVPVKQNDEQQSQLYFDPSGRLSSVGTQFGGNITKWSKAAIQDLDADMVTRSLLPGGVLGQRAQGWSQFVREEGVAVVLDQVQSLNPDNPYATFSIYDADSGQSGTIQIPWTGLKATPAVTESLTPVVSDEQQAIKDRVRNNKRIDIDIDDDYTTGPMSD